MQCVSKSLQEPRAAGRTRCASGAGRRGPERAGEPSPPPPPTPSPCVAERCGGSCERGGACRRGPFSGAGRVKASQMREPAGQWAFGPTEPTMPHIMMEFFIQVGKRGKRLYHRVKVCMRRHCGGATNPGISSQRAGGDRGVACPGPQGGPGAHGERSHKHAPGLRAGPSAAPGGPESRACTRLRRLTGRAQRHLGAWSHQAT
jgi:hypothetical protein